MGMYHARGDEKAQGHGGLFSVIEDEFYQSQPGTASPAQAQARPESFYVLTKQEISSKDTQVIAGYSSILDARLGIEDHTQS